MQPTPKIQAVGAAGAATTILVFVVQQLGLEIPAEVAAAATVLISTAAGWWKSDRPAT